jgi:thioredoxin 1
VNPIQSQRAEPQRNIQTNTDMNTLGNNKLSLTVITALIMASAAVATPASAARLPRLVDLGADKCIPCKMMAPILKELKTEFAGRMEVEFIDVWKNPDAGRPYKIKLIPTQIFFDAGGKELFRHEGFFGREDILKKWKELGVDLQGKQATEIVRETPVKADSRSRESVCYMCDGDIDPKTKVVVKGRSEQRLICSPHCYFIYYSSIVGADPKAEEAKVSVTDWSTGDTIPAVNASFLYGMDAKGRPTVKAFAAREAATKEQPNSPGNIVGWELLRSKELATRCAFCDRAVYPEDACGVKFGSTHGHGCCTHCAVGVAARLKQDIEVEARDGFTGDVIQVKTLDGQIASMEPVTAIAWFGQHKNAEGKWVSAGCFKQGFFVSEANLQKWLDARPAMTGRQISIAQALADKMKLSPEQIAKACKLGECK